MQRGVVYELDRHRQLAGRLVEAASELGRQGHTHGTQVLAAAIEKMMCGVLHRPGTLANRRQLRLEIREILFDPTLQGDQS